MLDEGPALRRRRESEKKTSRENKEEKKKVKMSYNDKLEVEHTYTAIRGNRKNKK